MRGELLRMLLARRESGGGDPTAGYDLVWEVEATAVQLEYKYYAKNSFPYEMDWGDGTIDTIPVNSSQVLVGHTYSEAGTYLCRIKEGYAWTGAMHPQIGSNSSSYRTYAGMARRLFKAALKEFYSSQMFAFCTDLALADGFRFPQDLSSPGTYCFNRCGNLDFPASYLEGFTAISAYTFQYCQSLTIDRLPSTLTSIGNSAFAGCWGSGSHSLTFQSTPTINAAAFISNAGLKDIYVPWSEGAVANAPWGATNATVHYNS